MNNYEEDFLKCFNECYPFDRYIFEEAKNLGMAFDDIRLTEIFVPHTEIKPILSHGGEFIEYTKIPYGEVFVKVVGLAGEMRIGFLDFEEHIRQTIIETFIEDFGEYEYECLYVDYEDDNNESLEEVLIKQKNLIREKYGECHIKPSLRCNLVEKD
jgi:hypothetical protein